MSWHKCTSFSKCSLYTHQIFTVCSLYIHCMFTIYSVSTQNIFKVTVYQMSWHKCTSFSKCSLYTHQIFTVCSLYIHCMFTICSLYIHCMFAIYSVHSKELVPLLFLCKYCLIHYRFHYNEEFLSILLAEVQSTVLPDFLLAKFPPLLIMASLKNRIFRIPARQLNSKRIENSLKANIIPLVSTDLLLP